LAGQIADRLFQIIGGLLVELGNADIADIVARFWTAVMAVQRNPWICIFRPMRSRNGCPI
jgi:hypothetical protein